MDVRRFSRGQDALSKNPFTNEKPGLPCTGKRFSLLPFLLTLIKRNEVAEGESF